MKRILTATILSALIVLAVVDLGQAQGGLTVRTSPTGAVARLDGEADIYAVTPAVFTYPLIGEYRLTVSKHGYETYRTRLVLDPENATELDVELTPRSGFKAGLRSMVLPGWGQFYGERETKGFVFSLLFAGSLTALAITNSDYNSKKDDYDARLEDYDNALAAGATFDELSRLHAALASAQDKAYDAQNARRLTAGIAIGVWGLNVLDALLFTPTERATFSVKGLSLKPSADFQTFGLTLTKAF